MKNNNSQFRIFKWQLQSFQKAFLICINSHKRIYYEWHRKLSELTCISFNYKIFQIRFRALMIYNSYF